jgi:nitroreductase
VDLVEAIESRRSVRAYLPTAVPQETVAAIMELSLRSPSGTNMQPWTVHAVSGAVKQGIADDVIASRRRTRETGVQEHVADNQFYPDDLGEPWRARRRAIGWDLYGLLGIEKGDRDRTFEQQNRNFTMFDAPVGLFVFIDKSLMVGSWLDLGMLMQTIMLVAREHGLHTCPQAAWHSYHKIVRKWTGAGEHEALAGGISLGYEDTSAIENTLRTPREPVEDVVTFSGFN